MNQVSVISYLNFNFEKDQVFYPKERADMDIMMIIAGFNTKKKQEMRAMRWTNISKLLGRNDNIVIYFCARRYKTKKLFALQLDCDLFLLSTGLYCHL